MEPGLSLVTTANIVVSRLAGIHNQLHHGRSVFVYRGIIVKVEIELEHLA